jgi:hypothetical protein
MPRRARSAQRRPGPWCPSLSSDERFRLCSESSGHMLTLCGVVRQRYLVDDEPRGQRDITHDDAALPFHARAKSAGHCLIVDSRRGSEQRAGIVLCLEQSVNGSGGPCAEAYCPVLDLRPCRNPGGTSDRVRDSSYQSVNQPRRWAGRPQADDLAADIESAALALTRALAALTMDGAGNHCQHRTREADHEANLPWQGQHPE